MGQPRQHFKTYADFMQAVDNDNRYECIIYYSGMFEIYLDKESGTYYYAEVGENDASDFGEIECVARLLFDKDHDIQVKDGDRLRRLFECDLCGEADYGDHIEYMWFKITKDAEDNQ